MCAEESRQTIFEYIEVFDNRLGKHSANGYLAPFTHEQKLAQAAAKKSVRNKLAISDWRYSDIFYSQY